MSSGFIQFLLLIDLTVVMLSVPEAAFNMWKFIQNIDI